MIRTPVTALHEPLVQLFQRRYGASPRSILDVAADGSSRIYVRLVGGDGETAIGGIGPDREENRAFLSFSRTFHGLGLPVPEIYGADEGAGVWLEEDLGDTTLFHALSSAREDEDGFPDTMVPVYERVVEALPRFQIEGGRAVDYTVAYPRAAFDEQSIRWDLNYFKYHFLKLAHVPFNEERLETDFHALVQFLLRADTSYFLYRDFQSRNIMLRGGAPWFIDYQGGRKGALHYDVASLLYDAKAAITEDVRERLLQHYLSVLETLIAVDRDRFRELFRGYVLIRIMQAMGAYGYRGFFERKPRFLQSVPYAAYNIGRILDEGLPVPLPELEVVFGRIVEQWGDQATATEWQAGLTVRVTSFSFRRGYPEDHGGHGGGFVFDCRALPNPGRQPEYAGVTGLDPAVQAFIENSPAAERYWRDVRSLVDAQVAEYLQRGFTSLAVNFGCTGGQHRSVYMADRLASHLRSRFPEVKVELIHREARFWPSHARTRATETTSPASLLSSRTGP